MSHQGLSPISELADLCGRSSETQLLLGRLLHDRIVLMYGASGIGKSSLIKASLLPLLRRYVFSPLFSANKTDDQEPPPTFFQDVTCFFFEPLFEPLDDQIQSLTKLEVLVRVEPGPARCLIFDRLDALLDESDKLDSVMRLLAELERNQSTWLLLSIREEALPEFERRFTAPYPRLFQTLFRLDGIKKTSVESLLDSQLAAARFPDVQFPLLTTKDILANIKMSADLVDPLRLAMAQEMLADASQHDVLAPNRSGDIVVSYYEHQLKKAFTKWNAEQPTRPLDEFVVRLSLEKSLIEKRETLRALFIIDGTDDPLPPGFYKILAIHCRLLRSQQKDTSVKYTLSHDRLIPAVRSANRAWVESHQPLAVSSARWWKLHGRPSSALLRGRSLWIARGWVRRLERHEGIHSMFAWEEIVDFVHQSWRRQLRRYLQLIFILLSSLSAGAYGSALLIAEHQRLQTYELEAGVLLRSVGKTARIGPDTSYLGKPELELENLICRAQTDMLEFELDRLHRNQRNALKLIPTAAEVKLLKRCKMIFDDLEDLNNTFKSIGEVLKPSGHDAAKPSVSPLNDPQKTSISTNNSRGVKPAGKMSPKRRASSIVP